MDKTAFESAPAWSELCKLIGIAADWVWELDREFRCCAIEGSNVFDPAKSKKQLHLGKQPWEIGLELHGSETWDDYQAMLSAAKPFRNVVVQRRYPDGKILYAHISGKPIFSEQGDLTGYRGLGVDITESQLANLEHLWFTAVVDTSPNSILITDIETQRFLYANETAYRSKGITKEEHLALDPGKLTGTSRSELAKFYQAVIAAGDKGITSKPMIFEDASGKHRSYWELHRRAINVDGRWLLSTISRDVSAKVVAEEIADLTAQMYEARCAIDDLIEQKLEVSELFKKACQQISKSDHFNNVSLLMKSADSRTLETKACSGTGADKLQGYLLSIDEKPARANNLIESMSKLEENSDLIEMAFWSHQPIVSTNFNKAANTKKLSALLNDPLIKSAIAIPLLDHNESKGVLLISSVKRRAFTNKCVEIATRMTMKLSNAHAQMILQQEAEDAEARIRYLASHDPLTGLRSRNLFDELLRAEIQASERKKSRFALLFIDLDQFSAINKAKGFAIGDQILTTVAGRLKQNINSSDAVTRIGADQFLVMARDAGTADSAQKLAQKLLKAINQSVTIQGQPHAVRACIGVALYSSNASTERELLRLAHSATAKAKQTQKNSIVLAPSS